MIMVLWTIGFGGKLELYSGIWRQMHIDRLGEKNIMPLTTSSFLSDCSILV
jgi:hypothetical protein